MDLELNVLIYSLRDLFFFGLRFLNVRYLPFPFTVDAIITFGLLL